MKGWPKGKPRSKENKQKISKALMGHPGYWKGKKHTEEHKQKVREANQGKVLTKRHKKRIGKGMQKTWANSETNQKLRNAFTGKPLTKEHRKKISDAQIGMKCRLYIDGRSNEPYSPEWTERLKRQIRERDNYTCANCFSLKRNREHNVHHIDYDKKNNNPENLITLCASCHSKTNFEEYRAGWQIFFEDIQRERGYYITCAARIEA